MASKILLISANRCTTPEPVFPLGLLYLCAALRQAGHDCVWLDWLTHSERIADTVRRFAPDFVGISLRNIDDVVFRKRETFFTQLLDISAAVRQQSNYPVILGSSGFSIFPQQLMELAGADFGIAGEGERAMVSLIAALEHGESYRGIPGLLYREKEKIVFNAATTTNSQVSVPKQSAAGTPLHLEPQLDLGGSVANELPSTIAIHYLQNGGMLNVQTQRGCSHRCCYCTYPIIEGAQHRVRPPELVAEEFERAQRSGANYVFIVDSIFNSSPHHVVETCEMLLKRGSKIPWCCFLRPEGLTRDLMRLMARAGLAHIEFGSDSFCDNVLAAYHKQLVFEDILDSNELARQEKIDCCHFLIIGGPGETRETLTRTFANSLLLESAVFMPVVGMRIYPGTELFKRAVSEGQIHRDVDLLVPTYYLAAGLNAEEIFTELRGFACQSLNWVIGDPDPAFQQLVSRLRQRGIAGHCGVTSP